MYYINGYMYRLYTTMYINLDGLNFTTIKYINLPHYRKLDSDVDIGESLLYQAYDENKLNKLYGSGWSGTVCPKNSYYDNMSSTWLCISNPDDVEYKCGTREELTG